MTLDDILKTIGGLTPAGQLYNAVRAIPQNLNQSRQDIQTLRTISAPRTISPMQEAPQPNRSLFNSLILPTAMRQIQPIVQPAVSAMKYIQSPQFRTGVQNGLSIAGNELLNTVKAGVPAAVQVSPPAQFVRSIPSGVAQARNLLTNTNIPTKNPVQNAQEQLDAAAKATRLALLFGGGAKIARAPLKGALDAIFSGVAGGAINKAQGKPFSEGFGYGVGTLPAFEGASAVGNRLVGPLANRIPNSVIGRIARSALGSGAGMGAYEATGPANSVKERLANTAKGIGMGAVFGAGTGAAGEAAMGGKKLLSDILKARTPKEIASIKPPEKPITMKDVGNGRLVRDLRTTETPGQSERVPAAGGGWMWIKKRLTPESTGGKRTAGALIGAGAGIELKRDKNGKLTLGYNTQRGAAGALVGGYLSTIGHKQALVDAINRGSTQEEAITSAGAVLDNRLQKIAKELDGKNVKDALANAKGLRAAINKVMYELSGVDPKNGKYEKVVYESMKQDPEISGIIGKLESYLGPLDEMLSLKESKGMQVRKIAELSGVAAKTPKAAQIAQDFLQGTQAPVLPGASTEAAATTLPIDSLKPRKYDLKEVYPLNVESYMEKYKTNPENVPPIKVVKTKSGYTIVDGHARYVAAKNLGMTDVPVEIVKASPKQGALGLPTEPTPAVMRKPQTLNVERLNLSNGEKQLVAGLESTEKRTVLPNKKVVEAAAGATPRAVAPGEAATTQKTAEDLALRQRIVSNTKTFFERKSAGAPQAELDKLMSQIASDSKVSRQAGTDVARQLQAQTILADEQATPMEKVFKLLDNAGVKPEDYVKRAATVDWGNAHEVTDFYREFVPAKFGDFINEYRYTNMLSSPKTHLVNIFSNITQTAVQPVRKAIAGGYDAFHSFATGKERTQYAGEVTPFVRQAIGAVPKAWKNAMDSLTGKTDITNLDLTRLPTGNKVMEAYKTPLRALEGADQFFRTILEAGQKGALELRNENLGTNLSTEELQKQAHEYALDVVFRGKLYKEGQGWMSNFMDGVTSLILKARNIKGLGPVASTLVPFIQTPMNILKQGIEYSPLEFLNMINSGGDTADQLAKATIGSMVMASAGYLAAIGDATLEAPPSAKERTAFYDAGRQPYSIKIGDQWYSYTKLGPLGYPIAMAAAIKVAMKNKTSDQDALMTAGNAVAMVGKYFTDQSYMQTIGDLIDAARGDEFKQTRLLSSPPQQLVPYKAFLSWVSRIIDPINRKVNWTGGIPRAIGESFLRDLPIASMGLPAYETQFGAPSERPQNLFNQISPLGVTKERPFEENLYQRSLQQKKQTQETNIIKNALADRTPGGATDTLGTEPIDKLSRLYKIDEWAALPSASKYDLETKDEQRFKLLDKVMGEDKLTDQEKQSLATDKLGIPKADVTYYTTANQGTDPKAAYLEDIIDSGNKDVFNTIARNRKVVGDKMVATDAVISKLYDDGYLSKQDAADLKKLTYDKKTNKIVLERAAAAGAGTAKAKKIASILNQEMTQNRTMLDKIFKQTGKRTSTFAGLRPLTAPTTTPITGTNAVNLDQLLANSRRRLAPPK